MKLMLVLCFLLSTLCSTAQNTVTPSPFRNGYQRLGLNFLGKKLDKNLSPQANIFNGNLGTSTGYCLEFGRNFYFNKKSVSPFRFGLDWTYLSFAYNKFDWDGYAKSSASNDVYIEGTSTAAAASGRLGPVISYNPVEKLVIDLRFQVAPTLYFFDQSYYENPGEPNERYFQFMDDKRAEDDSDYDSESIKNRLSFGVKTAFGITVRRKAIGLALDYSPGSVNANYESNESHGQKKIKVNNLQLKLSFQL